ncbi:MAG: hypothetical protein JSR26_03395 [Proteobacteria bacterium]|nr:hypothetical protein [Pseudomonadota bacterium]
MSQHDRNDANTPVDGQPNAPVRACLRRPAVPVPTHNPAPTMSEPPVIDGFYDISIDENWPGAPMATAGDAPAYVPTLADLADAGDMDDFGDDELDFDEMDDEHELVMQEADIDNADHARDKEEGWYYDDEDEDVGDPRDAGEADDEDGEDDGTAQ